MGGFFFGFAEQSPDVLGGEAVWAPLAAPFWFLE